MSLEELLAAWKEVRSGLISEIEQIPSDQFGFQATPETRSVAGIVRHIIGAPDVILGELCRADTDFKRIPYREIIQKHAAEAHTSGDKEELIQSLRSSMESAEATLREFGEEALKEKVPAMDGRLVSKLTFLSFYVSHEMYHRGQISVYERLMQIEPALTKRFREFLNSNP